MIYFSPSLSEDGFAAARKRVSFSLQSQQSQGQEVQVKHSDLQQLESTQALWLRNVYSLASYCLVELRVLG